MMVLAPLKSPSFVTLKKDKKMELAIRINKEREIVAITVLSLEIVIT